MTVEDLARVIFCAVNDCDPAEEQDHIDAAFAGRRYCDGSWISANNARIAACAALQASALRVEAAMRSTENMVSVPHGDYGAKVVITMSEETDLYDMLSAAWDQSRAALKPSDKAPQHDRPADRRSVRTDGEGEVSGLRGYDCCRCWREARDRGEASMFSRIMQLCPTCGNKRCPKASDHRLYCTGSNEPGQPGSIYGPPPSPMGGEDSPKGETK